MSDNVPFIIDQEPLEIIERVRHLPNKRSVYHGFWLHQYVYCKVYKDPKRAQIHWQRELEGINALIKKKILTADLLYSGRTESGEWVIVLSEIKHAATVLSAFSALNEDDDQLFLLEKMAELIADHHNLGLIQEDLHFGNFLLKENELYTLDGASIKTESKEVGIEKGLSNLALMMAQLFPEFDRYASAVLKTYQKKRKFDVLNQDDFKNKISEARDLRLKKYQSKLFRTCTDFLSISNDDLTAMLERKFMSDTLVSFLTNIDGSLKEDKQLLKDGNTCTVWRTKSADLDLVVKRYNVKNKWHRIKLQMKTSRAKINWVNSHLLLFFGISSLEPIAYIESNKASGGNVSYFIYKHLDGISSLDWFKSDVYLLHHKKNMADGIIQLLRQLKRLKIYHGDLKATNILIKNKPIIIDLDSMKRFDNMKKFNKAWEGSIKRFMRNWEFSRVITLFFNQDI